MEEVCALKARIKFRKYGAMKFIGHLDMMRYFQKAMRRARIPIAFSGGYSPHMIMSFANPLGVGLTSEGEYFDIELTEPIASKEAVDALNSVMVEGVEVTGFVELPDDQKTGMSIVAAAGYRVSFPGGDFTEELKEKVKEFMESEEILIMKKTKRSEQEVDILPLIHSLEVQGDTIYMFVCAGSAKNLKPELVMEAFFAYALPDGSRIRYACQRIDNYAEIQKDGQTEYVPLLDLGREILPGNGE